ncbi:uncharacterized protein LAESUDRAFT_762660 [Laetiporus sulphureus 93-53]|uniref:Aspartic peptidase DDI1-type domain-containing protein n=1 Tax=Laetiporus sulphureus 93-53 TaxID=1314785 RepID=A0A165CBT4_9APHY|nr:uncharacterized protein LAESUDRAFT_762660 [Laetiporus sulphureus 93-53]KZT02527.1 hypothetical protein LAESUDRAFT_762660 [Laetiporus sulphureus 93-53]
MVQPGSQVTSASVEEVVDEEYALKASANFTCGGEPLKLNGSIVPDPYKVYLCHIHKHSEPDQLMVAKESHAVRLVFNLVDNKENVEAIVDPGCQIVVMSENVCHALRLIYDPTVKLNMQSMNGEVNQSLSIIRNIPFQIGEIVLYLQIHVIHAAAYDILLGRPFDVLTESVVKNFFDEKQTIMIMCPNTGQVTTIPTFTQIEKALNWKMRPWYIGPYVVLLRNKGGAYVLAKLDGAMLDQPVGAFRVIPFLARKKIIMPEEVLDVTKKQLEEIKKAEEPGDEEEEQEQGESDNEQSGNK